MELFDLYLIHQLNEQEFKLLVGVCKLPSKPLKSFLGLKMDLKHSINLKKQLDKNKIAVFIVPIAYTSPKIDYATAQEIAENEFLKVAEKDEKRYGLLNAGAEHPMWFTFVADDYALQAEGFVPGYWGCAIDKITGKLVEKKEMIYYQFL